MGCDENWLSNGRPRGDPNDQSSLRNQFFMHSLLASLICAMFDGLDFLSISAMKDDFNTDR